MDIEKINRYLDEFGKRRGWDRVKNPKNMSMALSVEAAELVEIFQWMDGEFSREVKNDPVIKEAVRDELADILAYLIQIANVLDISLEEAFWLKSKKNEKKYPEPCLKESGSGIDINE